VLESPPEPKLAEPPEPPQEDGGNTR
jgi:hypothetical protein